MLRYFFSADGRFNRARFWLGQLALLGFGVAAIAVVAVLIAAPHLLGGDGTERFVALTAPVSGLLMLAVLGLIIWVGICLGIKRFHDLDKPGAWVLIQFAPIVGPIWYFVEAGCLAGTRGPNRYGPDPLRSELGLDPFARPGFVPRETFETRGRPAYVLPLMLLIMLPGVLLLGAALVAEQRASAWLKSAVHVEGTITALEPETTTQDSRTTKSYRPIYEARTPEGEPIKVRSFWAVTPAPEIGSHVELAYQPGRAATARAVGWTYWILPAFLFGWGTMWAGFWLFLIVLVVALWKRPPRRPAAGITAAA